MPDNTEPQEEKIKVNLQILRQAFEPLTVQLTPEIEPAAIYLLPAMAKTSDDD